MTSVDVRKKLVHALGVDMIGPDCDDSALHGEVLPQAPSRWYLTGFLVPIDADEDGKSDEAGTEGVDELGKGTGVDDEATPEPAAAQKTFFPSSMGMSLLVPKDAKELKVSGAHLDGTSEEHNPVYKLHSSAGLARCWINEKWVTLGKYGTPGSRAEFARIVAETDALPRPRRRRAAARPSWKSPSIRSSSRSGRTRRSTTAGPTAPPRRKSPSTSRR